MKIRDYSHINCFLTKSKNDFDIASLSHEYDGEISATWNGNDNSVIDVTNHSNVDISVKLDFIPSSDFSNLSGDFYSEGILVNDKVVLSENASEQFNCKLSGSIPSTTKDNTSGGKITVTVSSNQ